MIGSLPIYVKYFMLNTHRVMRSSQGYAVFMRFPPLPFAVLDTETTGFVPRVHHIVELACERYEHGTVAGTFEALTSAPDELPPHVQVLTRIYPEMLEGKPTIDAVNDAFITTLGAETLLVGQNLQFDLNMLKGDGIDLSNRPWIDTSLLAALAFPELKSYSLQYLSKALHLPHEPQHRALGDVRATAALLGAIWERLCELPAANVAEAKAIMCRASDGYRMFFDALPTVGGNGAWLENARNHHPIRTAEPMDIPQAAPKTVTLLEEPLDPSFVPSLIAGAANDTVRTWIAVKNLDNALKRHDISGVTVIHPSSQLLNPDAALSLKNQTHFTPDEATLALKLSWFQPRSRADLALHAGERDTWNGKLAATDDHSVYQLQFKDAASVRLIDHRQLLTFLREGSVMHEGDRVIIDDASMLEDTATKALGTWIALDDLRAAAQGSDMLMRIADRAALWAETVKNGEDQHMLTAADRSRRETTGLATLVNDTLSDTTLPTRVRYILTELRDFLTPATTVPMLAWIETRAQSGSVNLTSAPERVDLLLKQMLYEKFATILLVPPSLKGVLPAVLPEGYPHTVLPASSLATFAVSFPDTGLEALLQHPPEGKTIALVGSKRIIENAFVKHTVRLEEAGVTLICQGMSGGQGRMESDFLAAEGTTIWMLTPWMYEGIDLPEHAAHHLALESVPFDHPGQPVFARRKDMFGNGFEQYALIRLYHRLFRLLRGFARHAAPNADVMILDQRMKEKSYGSRVQAYFRTFALETTGPCTTNVPKGKAAPKKKQGSTNDNDAQLSLPL